MASGDGRLGLYLVAFVDILGQGSALKRLRRLPTTKEERNELSDVLRQSVGRVLSVRRAFADLFDKASTGWQERATELPSDIRNEYRAAKRLRLTTRGFSDSFVVNVPLREEQGNILVPMNAVRATLTALSGLSVAFLARGFAIRGGIDVGLCVELPDGEVYGEALRSAYELESRHAEYPRVLVGEGLSEYLDYVKTRPAVTIADRVASEMVPVCEAAITSDATDGRKQLDHRHCWDTLPRQVRAAACEWVAREQCRFVAEKNDKLGERYARLMRCLGVP